MSLKDEPDFEVTDLRTGRLDERVYAHDEQHWQRRRVLSVVVTALVLLCLLIVPFFSVPGFRTTLRQALHLATPASASQGSIGDDVIYFEHGLPWGALLVDGKLVTNVDAEQPYTGFEQLYTSLRLPQGRHLLTYSATPFPTTRCWLSVPAAHSDTCPLIRERSPQDVLPPYPAERVLDLGGDPENLAPQLRAALQAAVTRTVEGLSTTTTLAAGEHFADTTGAPQIASDHMRATLSYSVATDAANVYIIPGNSRSCAILCPIQAASYLNTAQGKWAIAAHVVPVWTYQPGSGGSFEGSASPQGVLPDSIVPLNVSWDSAWHVTLAQTISSSPMCFIALNLISSEHLAGAPLSTLQMHPATNPADGCLVTGDALDASGIPSIPFTVMYRFGLLFAIDNEARALLPAMGVADPHLQALAHSWQG